MHEQKNIGLQQVLLCFVFTISILLSIQMPVYCATKYYYYVQVASYLVEKNATRYAQELRLLDINTVVRREKVAGMDYWKELDVEYYRDYTDFLEKNPRGQKVFLSKKASLRCDQFVYETTVYLIFGKESVGLPEALLLENRDNGVRIPMSANTRSLNLANTVAIMSYEVMRQCSFAGLKVQGDLPSKS